jgi:hypothetical protein
MVSLPRNDAVRVLSVWYIAVKSPAAGDDRPVVSGAGDPGVGDAVCVRCADRLARLGAAADGVCTGPAGIGGTVAAVPEAWVRLSLSPLAPAAGC